MRNRSFSPRLSVQSRPIVIAGLSPTKALLSCLILSRGGSCYRCGSADAPATVPSQAEGASREKRALVLSAKTMFLSLSHIPLSAADLQPVRTLLED
jgi:hypothetical protein